MKINKAIIKVVGVVEFPKSIEPQLKKFGYEYEDDILKKNLIQISISKAKSHGVVQNKLREQLKSSKKSVETMCNSNQHNKREQMQNFTSEQPKTNVDFTASGFSDTFQHFNEEKISMDGIQAFENNDLVKF